MDKGGRERKTGSGKAPRVDHREAATPTRLRTVGSPTQRILSREGCEPLDDEYLVVGSWSESRREPHPAQGESHTRPKERATPGPTKERSQGESHTRPKERATPGPTKEGDQYGIW